ncbi:ARPP-1 family domain-containing protein [Nonomuraea sp. NPDC049480]|uniref:ARPP-1 family domain-containing protein n=1 Tax=Nonomuraea sp. NPDC049480 TaxID=3364353 RepID=UPI0037BD5690
MTTTALDRLLPTPLDLDGYRLGTPQRAGALTMVPVWGPHRPGFVPPRSGLKLKRVVGYGQVELHNGARAGVAIVPLHIGYIQDGAQNHALCSSALLGAGQTRRFDDACCVQAAQGGYLEGRDQWFFVLPAELRAKALELRGRKDYAKLWPDISELNRAYGLPSRGHLEQIISRKRAMLTQFQNRLELVPGQLGAIFFLRGRFAGLELAPDPAYFAELWTALVCFAYGVAAWQAEPERAVAEPYEATGLAELRAELTRDRDRRTAEVASWMAGVGGDMRTVEEERYLDLRLSTVTGDGLAGQVVTERGRPVYASVFAAR